MPSGLSKSGNKSSKILLDIESRHNSTNKATVKTTKSTKAPKFTIDEITHGTNADPNLITVEEVIKTIIGKDYPKPIVIHEKARALALEAFQSLIR